MATNSKDRSRDRKGLVKRLDVAFSLKVRLRSKREFDGWCQFCRLRGAQPHSVQCCFHFFSRTHYATRWDPENSEGSCNGCNNLYEYDRGFVVKVADWYRKKRGEKAWEELEKRHHSVAKFSTSDLREMLDAMTGNTG